MPEKKKPVVYYDPAERAAMKQAMRQQDMDDLASGKISRAELARRNSFFGALDFSKARIVNCPEDAFDLYDDIFGSPENDGARGSK